MAIYRYEIHTPQGTITAVGAVRATDRPMAEARIARKEALALAPLPGKATPNTIHLIHTRDGQEEFRALGIVAQL